MAKRFARRPVAAQTLASSGKQQQESASMVGFEQQKRRRSTDLPHKKLKQAFGVLQRLAVIFSLVGATFGLLSHARAYAKYQAEKIRSQQVLEGRLLSLEGEMHETRGVLKNLDTDFVSRREMNERDKRENERDAQLARLEETMDRMYGLITRIATTQR